jgi:hypothetical protein
VIEGSVLVLKKIAFSHLVIAVLVLSFIIGFAVFVLSGATTNKGTTSAIRVERASIMSAERRSCQRYGTYASISVLRKERLLTFTPVYNSVVIIPGAHCGTIIVGSPSYQSTSN